MDQVSSVIEAISGLSVTVVILIVLGLLAYALMRVVLFLPKFFEVVMESNQKQAESNEKHARGIEKIAACTESTNLIVKQLVSKDFKCEAKELYEELLKSKKK